ncbi:hypothetical protein HMN09_00936200 [Mycena chlorophos]|uniref:Histone deacetylase domain-containing protein n=1 Tax=Mycena chlorophos TaxID=658473 RepID=A0A8H6SKH4_MYCCL|nr:hypothetical protein HMN09_00936200 [Mycena chlorophos]
MAQPSPHPATAIFLQDACHNHRFIRSRDTSTVVERPERLRAVATGLACAIARLEEMSVARVQTEGTAPRKPMDPDELASQLGKMDLAQPVASGSGSSTPVAIVRSSASLSILAHPAVKYIHGDIDGDVYLENLVRWVKESKEKIEQDGSEIPPHLSQGDLYLCPESLDAIQGALGTVCEAVDAVMTPSHSTKRAFVAVRPPGHHCGEDSPSGFCFVNNVAVAAAHAHLQHGVDRIVIFDIDLHHGNGTQSISWQINEETYRQTLESEGGAPSSKRGPQVYYSSIHDILSYPCEDGKPHLVQAASTSLHGPHGQYIENVHLKEYTSAEHFDRLYRDEYSKILRRAEEFLESTSSGKDDVLVFISCGMDASEHEMPSMSRHNRRVPTVFFHRFARDASALAAKYASGRLISVLEGGYSDRALASGAMAHLLGLAGDELAHTEQEASEWWALENLILLEKATKKRRAGGRPSLPPHNTPPWLDRTVEIFTSIDGSPPSSSTSSSRSAPPPSSRTLRERKTKGAASSAASSARNSPAKTLPSVQNQDSESSLSDLSDSPDEQGKPVVGAPAKEERKLPRVILKLGPAP